MISPYRIRPNAGPSLEIVLRPSVEYWVRVVAAGTTVVLGLLASYVVARSVGGWVALLVAFGLLLFAAPAVPVLLTFPRDRRGSRVSVGGGAVVVRSEGRTERVPFTKLRLVLDRRRGRLIFDEAGRVTLTLSTHRRQDLRVLQDRLHQITGMAVGDAEGPRREVRPGSIPAVEIRLRRPSFAWALPGIIGVVLAVPLVMRGLVPVAALVVGILGVASWVARRELRLRLPRSLRVNALGLSVTDREGKVTVTPRIHLRPMLTAGLLRFPAAGCSVHAYQLESPSEWPVFLAALSDCVGHDVSGS
ncbi:MAG: hypothetical protein DRJ42_12320 [Deltaproteobacteria bacterium]|nr:MAG: hypothetical protein DRJ42_12320 [Deltaproteobacteria bacterium]